MVRNNPAQAQKGVQAGGRPFLILSNDERGENCTAVEGLWCTSQQKPFMRINVPYKNEKGETNTVLCNQHVTLSINLLVEYLGTLSDSKMREVEEGMLFACGMGKYIDLEKNMNKILELVRESGDDKVRSYLEGQIDELYRINMTLEKIRSNLEKQVDGVRQERPEAVPPAENSGAYLSSPKKSHKILCEDRTTARTTSPQSKPTPAPKKKRNSWTEETMRQFIRDRENMTLTQVAEKYGLGKGTCSQFYYKFKAQLGD